jgi:D-sedoheptulose 7-phosphate isomerase
MDSKDKIFLRTRNEEALKVGSQLDYELALQFAEDVFKLRGTSNKVFFIGNGASNTIANHAALDYMSQTGIQTVCVNDAAILTAFSNDFGYDQVFSRYLKINYKPGDILVAVSSSGNSPNVLNAVNYMNNVGGTVYGFSGFSRVNKLAVLSKKNSFWANSKKYNVVESVHNLWLAMICDLLIEWMGEEVGVHGINI